MITLKTIKGTPIVTVNGEKKEFNTLKEAFEYIASRCENEPK